MQAIRPIKRGDPRVNRGQARRASASPHSGPQPIETARLFLALWPEEPIRQRLLACRDAWAWGRRVGRVPPAHLHLTLHFLGEVARERVPALLDGLAVPVVPFELVLGPLAVWPNGAAVWLPVDCPAPLTRLHGMLGDALASPAVPLEARAYRPHVTLARRARDTIVPTPPPPLAWPIDRYALVESCPGPSRRYEVLRVYR